MTRKDKNGRPINEASVLRQSRLASRYHTCTCRDRWVIDWETTHLIDVDFDKADQPAPAARMIWFVSRCKTCKKQLLHGTSFTDYRNTGQELLAAALKQMLSYVSEAQRPADPRAVLLMIMKKQNPKLEVA